MHSGTIPKRIVNLLLKDKFNGEGEISGSVYSLIFQKKKSFKIVVLGLI
jgi:hypothetical protein